MPSKRKRIILTPAVFSLLLFLLVPSFFSLQHVFAEDVIFIVPGSSDPRVVDFDPELQIIESGQSIVFVNADGLDHHLIIKSADGNEEFDTGLLKQNQFISHTFSKDGEYLIQCEIFPDMKGTILVTDDIATFTKTIEGLNLDVWLTRSPANPGVNEEIYYKVTFINTENGRNYPHIDFSLTFNDSSSNYVDGARGHTVDGQEFAVFRFDKEDAFTPAVTVSGVSFVPINPETVTFDSVVTPEFSPLFIAVATAGIIGTTIALFRNRDRYNSP